MTKPKNPIELNYEDILSGGAAGTGSPGAAQTPGSHIIETGGSQDMFATINNLLERANTAIINFKELIAMAKGNNPNSQGPPGQQLYKPQPTLGQQLHRVVNLIYGAYGDITMAQLLELLVQQYGGTKLSAVLKLLEHL